MYMRKEYVVVRVDAAPDASPYVTVSLSSKKDVQEKNGPLPLHLASLTLWDSPT